MKECDFYYLDVVQGRLIKAWFGVSKFCSTTALREAIRWKRSFVVGEDTQSIPFGKHRVGSTPLHGHVAVQRVTPSVVWSGTVLLC